MNAQDAARLGLKEGQPVALKGSDPFVLSLRIHPALPSGVAAVPAGLAGMPVLPLPLWGRIAVAYGASTGAGGNA
jgi:hypothetical protein